MNQFDIESLQAGSKVHMIGIGGISMSGLAQILLKKGCLVSGSDAKESNLTQNLVKLGARIHIGHRTQNIETPDLVVYSAAIGIENPERQEAARLGIPAVERSILLGGIMKHFEKAIAVSGTHGKTSTTAMLAHIFLEAKTDPTISIGGELSAIDGNIRAGGYEYFITEACEYHRSFLEFFPLVSIILNVDADHLDYFKDINEIIDAFHDFALLTPDKGAVVVNADDDNAMKAVQGTAKHIIYVSTTGQGELCADEIQYDSFGCASFNVVENGKVLGRVSLKLPGHHHISNALCAYAAAHFLGIPDDSITKGLAAFNGVKRRFEMKGRSGGALIIDDYAHHPTEIDATLRAVEVLPHRDIYLVFQPHTYTRTKALLNDFAQVLSRNIHVIVTDIYAAREKDTGFIHARDLAAKIPNAIYLQTFDEIVAYLADKIGPDDIVMTMGAGNVNLIGETLVNISKTQPVGC